MLSWAKLLRVLESSVKVALVAGLGIIMSGVCLLVEGVQLAEEYVSKGNWLLQLCQFV